MTKPFENLVVIDFTHVLAGPACSYYLGLLGAKIIKVESQHKGDAIRHRGGTDKAGAARGMSTSYLTQGAGKSSISLDLLSPEGMKQFHQLLQRADILVENHIPATMAALGLDKDSLMGRHPHLIYCAMTGYGRDGPQENTAAYDVNIQAASGLMEMTGTSQTGPIRTGAPIMDYATALSAGFAISAALFHREKTGEGQFVDVSMLETGLSLMSSTITDYLATGHVPERRGNLANSRSPGAGSFACREGVLSLGVNEESHFVSLAKGLGCADWLEDVRFAKRSDRANHSDALIAELQDKLAQKTALEWEALLQKAGVPCAVLRSLPEALATDHIQEREFIQTTDDGTKVPTLPFRIGDAKAYKPVSNAPELGAQTDEIIAWLAREE